MSDTVRMDKFLSASTYKDQVDIKKLRFIYSALEKYLKLNSMSFDDINILEIACGNGGITLPLATLGSNIRAFDIDESSVAFVNNLVKRGNYTSIKITVENGYTFQDGKVYDILIASEVFEHVLNPAKLAGNITKSMSNGSYLIVTIPNGYGPWEIKNRLNIFSWLRKINSIRRLIGKSPYIKGNGADHCQFYTRKTLLNLLSEQNLYLIDFGKSDSILSALSFLRRNALIAGFDIKIADILPYWLSSGWYFVFQLRIT